VQPLAHRANRRVSVTARKPYTVVRNTPRSLPGLDKLPSHRSISRLTEPREGPRLAGWRVKKPAGTITLRSEEGEGLLAQGHQSHWPAAVAGQVAQIIRMYFGGVFALQEAKLSVKRLRHLLLGSRAQPQDRPAAEVEAPSSEAPRQAAGAEEAATGAAVAPCLETPGGDAGSGASENEAKPKPQGGPRAGTGRLGADAYGGAQRTECRQEDLAVGQRCPVCGHGTLEALPSGVALRMDGHAWLSAMRYELPQLRCAACGPLCTAPLPRPAGEETDSARARAVLAVSRYALGMPGYRVPGSQARLGVPGPDATQWDESEKGGDCAYVVCAPMAPVAAPGELRWQDDTAVRMLSLLQANLELLAAAQAHGLSTPQERTGMHTTALVVKGGEHSAILDDSSRRQAGANLQALLDQRAAGRDKPLAMSDALASHEVAQAAALLRCPCLAHGRRKFSAVAAVVPHACQGVLEGLRQVCDHDAQARQAQLSPEARLASHQAYRQPRMDGLKGGRATQRDEHLVEPNGSRGNAMVSMPRHGETLTRF